MNDLGHTLDTLTIAATRAIEDYSDVQVRGYLKEHPDLVAARLAELDGLLAVVRGAVERERAAGSWGGPVEGDPVEELIEEALEYGRHACDCPYCLHAAPAGDDGPVAGLTIPGAAA